MMIIFINCHQIKFPAPYPLEQFLERNCHRIPYDASENNHSVKKKG